VQSGARAQHELASEDLAPMEKVRLEALASDGRRAQQELAQSNLRLVVSWANATPAAAACLA